MAARDEERFRIRPGAPTSGAGPRSQRFVSQVLKQVSKAGAKASGTRDGRPASTFGRGRVAAGLAGQGLAPNARRVVIKSRFVVLKKAGANSVSTHLRYIERDGSRGQAYTAETDTVDLKAFQERGTADRHQFRFIVSVEDAAGLEELCGYTRELMRRISIDLETRLDWVAVDHWDTDNPHTHIVLRGRSGSGREGRDLVISPDYMAHGMRLRASELATEWLGPRTQLEIRQGLMRGVEQERLTSLDRALLRQSVLHTVDLTEKPGDTQRQALLRARLQRLESMALAERIDSNRWHLSVKIEPTLIALGERGDILRAMQKALQGQRREIALPTATAATPVIGRIVAKGLADELNDSGYLVVDGIDGRAHYVKLPAGTDFAQLPVGGIAEARAAGQERTVDRNIAGISQKDGFYRTAEHFAQLRQGVIDDPQAAIDAHTRRLEALCRASIVQRLADGVWCVPPDLLPRAQAYDAHKVSGNTIQLHSHLPIEGQIRTVGATWLDRQLLEEGKRLAPHGFGAQVRAALQGRAVFLEERGFAKRTGQRVILVRNLLSTLRDCEHAATGKGLQAETGLVYRPLHDGARINGLYSRSIQLASGRFAMLDDGIGFSLVPWRPVVEQRLGQSMTAIVRGSAASWQFGSQRGRGVS
ncbi:MAG: relaxase/mobilization nuclease and DUF3363 domain-containing protein [Ramlibacter sp.]|nr:relaxase/mobilization nuclease and DUF3363 domain-containing protein [Ramlibacter sp.]